MECVVSSRLNVQLVSLRPVSTYTVPPSTRFAGPALSYIIQPPSPLANGVGKGKGKERQVEEEAVAEMMESMDVDGAEEAELSSSVDSGEEPVQPSGPVRRTMVPVLSNEKGEVWVWDGEDGAEKVVIQVSSVAPSYCMALGPELYKLSVVDAAARHHSQIPTQNT
jgi:hypothetical protein